MQVAEDALAGLQKLIRRVCQSEAGLSSKASRRVRMVRLRL